MPHSSFIGNDGTEWPSVTEVCGVIAKPGLYSFYAKNGVEGAEKIKKDAGELGQQFHDGIYAKLNGSAPTLVLTAQAQQMIDAFFKEFVVPYKVTPLLLEKKVINTDKRYHGTFDGIVNVVNMPLEIRYGVASKELYTGPVLADWKSSNGIYESHGIQLGGYFKAEPNAPKTGLIVQVHRDTLKLKWKFFHELNYHGEVFYNAREIYDYINKKGMWTK